MGARSRIFIQGIRTLQFAVVAIAAIVFFKASISVSGAEVDKEGNVEQVVVYPVPDEVADSPYIVSVEDKRVPVERGAIIEPAYYARFQFTKTVRVRVSVEAEGTVNFNLKPERFRDRVEVARRSIAFDVSQAGPRVLTAKMDGKEMPPLLVIADQYDDWAPSSESERVFNVANYGVTSQGIQTERMQKALDDCAERPGGGIVYFGPGVYHTGSIIVKDNTTVYLAPGALIVGSTEPTDYPKHPNGRQLILFDHCSNSRLCGYGVVDGMGHILRNQKKMSGHLVNIIGCSNIKIENVVLRNSPAWCLHLLGCDGVEVDNLKIIGDWGVKNTDGIDPDCSRNVQITDYFGYCGDDAIAVKTTLRSGVNRPTRNIVVKDSVVMTKKTALKLGTESCADIRDVLFENIDVVSSSRGIALWMRDGFTFSNITFRDIRMDLREMEGENMSGEPIRAVIQRRKGIGKIQNVLFERVRSRAPYRSIFAGVPEAKLEKFTFRDCVWEVTPRTIKKDKKSVLEIRNARNFAFRNNQFKWLTDQRELWEGFVSEVDSENIVFDKRPQP